MSETAKRPYPEEREEPWEIVPGPIPGAPASVLGDPLYAHCACPCCQSKIALYFTADHVPHVYCLGCDHMHRVPEAIKKRRLS